MYVRIGKSGFCLAFYLTGVHFRYELQHVGHLGGQKKKCRLIRTREIGGVRFQEEIYADLNLLDIYIYISSVNVLFVSKTSSRHNLKTSLRRLCNASSICLEDVSEDERLLHWGHVEDVLKANKYLLTFLLFYG